MRLGHVNLYVRDAEQSRDWYARVLGLHTYHYRPGCAAFMSADLDMSHEVALMQVGPDAAGANPGVFYDGKRQAARYFFRYELPRTGPQLDLLEALDRTTVEMRPDWF